MGLIKAGMGALGGTLADQWKEFFYCDSLDKDVLMADILAGKDKGIADYYASMAQDVLMHRRQTEIDSLNGAVVEYGRRYGVPTPYNEVITEMICAIQNNYAVQYDTEQQA